MWNEMFKVGHCDLNMVRNIATFLVVLACNIWYLALRPENFFYINSIQFQK